MSALSSLNLQESTFIEIPLGNTTPKSDVTTVVAAKVFEESRNDILNNCEISICCCHNISCCKGEHISCCCGCCKIPCTIL